MGSTDSKILEGLTWKHVEKKNWVKKNGTTDSKTSELTWKHGQVWIEDIERNWLEKSERLTKKLTLNTEGLNKNVLLTPHSYCNVLQLFTFGNTLLELILLYVVIISGTHFRVNPHSMSRNWMSRNYLFETDAISDV